jgi:hypothetical protein
MMRLIDKAYFSLEEIEERWCLPHRDVAYLAENGLLRLSVRLFGVCLEQGVYEEDAAGEWCRIPQERGSFTGFQDLLERDVFQLFRDGEVDVCRFHAPHPEYRDLTAPSDSVTVRREDLLIRKPERDRVEAQHGLVRAGGNAATAAFQALNDYREVRLAGLVFNLGMLQSKVVKRLHHAASSANPWCDGKLVLGEAGAASTRMADVFKSQPHWRRLIESDRRGRYRLRTLQR